MNIGKKTIYTMVFFALMLVAAGRDIYVDNDYEVYADLFKNFSVQKFSWFYLAFYEPVFYLLPKLMTVLSLPPVTPAMTLLAIAGVGLKYKAFQASPAPLLSALFYIGSYFLLHECTQARVGVATGIWMLSIPAMVQRKWKRYYLLVLCCGLFHYASVLFLFAPLLLWRRISVPLLYIVLAVTLLAALAKVSVLGSLGILSLTPKTQSYVEALDRGYENQLNLFSYSVLVALFFASLLGYYRKRIELVNPQFALLYKVHLLSLILFYLFSDTAIFAMRFYELFGAIQPIIYAYAAYLIRSRLIVAAGLMVVTLAGLANYFFFNPVFKDYNTWIPGL